jgi:ribosomal protein S18 acetylase RimI-like enzyme
MGGKDAARTVPVHSADPPIPVRILPLSPHHAADAARLHIAGQTNTFLAELGPEILEVIYEKLPRTDAGFGFTALSSSGQNADPVVVGFVSAATSVGRVFLQTATTRAAKLLPLLSARCLRRPSLVGRTMQTAFYPFTRADSGSAHPRGTGAELLSIMVEPHWRSRGLGTLLLEALLDECKTRSITWLDVTVDADNDGARRFYERHGFQKQRSFALYGRTMLLYDREV